MVGAAATISRQRRLLGLGLLSMGVVIVGGMLARVGASIAAAMSALVALGTIGSWLWQAAPDRQQAKSNLGTGLLASVVVAAAIGSAQFAIDDRRRDIERARQLAAQKAADRQNLRLTLGLQPSLSGTDLANMDLKGFSFSGKRLQQVDLTGAKLAGAKFKGATMRLVELDDADLRGAIMSGAVIDLGELRGANLEGADLQGAKLRQADLRGGNLRHTRLMGACMHYASLAGADLRGAHLRLADLRGADLSGADLRAARLDGARLHPVSADSKTRWPASMKRRSIRLQADVARPMTCESGS